MLLTMKILFCLTVYFMFCQSSAEDIHCGGFIKSDVPLLYSKVEIKLFTPSGLLKYQTECAPNNGYYMIPFMEKEKFLLKVIPPEGWSFEPTSVDIDVNGIDDVCTRGEDINFKFTGFSVMGQVLDFASSSQGPADVELTLMKGGDTIATTRSTTGGSFSFKQVLPGKYVITAKHSSLSFQQESISVSVENDNVKCSEPFKVTGYDIHGKITDKNKSIPVKGVHILLLHKNANFKPTKCTSVLPTGADGLMKEFGEGFLCSVVSDDNGAFTFSALQPASYIIVAFHKGEHITYNVEPRSMKFTIGSGVAKLPGEFLVTGFSVTGVVISSVNGKPIKDVKISVNGKMKATSNQDGKYLLQTMNSQKYTITADKDGYIFNALEVALGPTTPRLPDMIAQQFYACGVVVIDDKPTDDFKEEQIAVKLDGPKNFKSEIVKLAKDRKFCFKVPSGKYSLQMWIPSKLQNEGLVFSPSNLEFTVNNEPMKGLTFTQVTGVVTMTIDCIGKCTESVTLSLSNADNTRQRNTVTTPNNKNQTVGRFEKVFPGKYDMKAVYPHWCMDTNTASVEVTRDRLSVESNLKQSGFQLTCSISHDTDMTIALGGDTGEEFSLKKGKNTLCLRRGGEYILMPKSCHKFEPGKVVYDTTNPKLVTLHATSHRVLIVMETTTKADDIDIEIKTNLNSETKRISFSNEILKEKSTVYVYTTEAWKKDGEKLTLTATSKILLFDEPEFKATVNADKCGEEFHRFQGFKGKFVEGKVTPALENVQIRLTDIDTNEDIVLLTDIHGKYSVGPLHPKTSHMIAASFDGYVLKQDGHNFAARKLSSIEFQVVGDKSIPLSGVLLTLSGGMYRSNNVTDNDGKLKLVKLHPGDYYFKVIKKEYQFEPASSLLVITEGKDVTVNVIGHRVAFSCYGSVTSLNGQPEVGVKMQAVGSGDCSTFVEEGETNVDGEYRLKGLLPHCNYTVQVKDSEKFESTLPATTVVQATVDVTDINFIMVLAPTQFRISGNIITDYSFLPQLKVLLYDVSNQNTLVETQVLSDSYFFFLSSVPRDGREYQIRVETTLDANHYDYILPAANFYSNGLQKHVTLKFNAELIAVDHEMQQGSLFTLVFALLIIAGAYYHVQVMERVRQMVEHYFTETSPSRDQLSTHNQTLYTKPRNRSRKT